MTTRQQLKEEFLTCIVCHEVFRDPVTLHCGHTFCTQCVTAYTKTQPDAIAKKAIPCPHCRGLTKVPDPRGPAEEWTGQIKTGFFVKGLVERFTDASEAEALCAVCGDEGNRNVAVVFCSDCKKDLCRECRKFHDKFLKGHRIEQSTEAVNQKEKPKGQICHEHDDSYIDMICEDCDKALCQRCCIVYHRRCESVITMKQAVSKFDTILGDQNKILDTKIEDLKSDVSLKKSQGEMLNGSAEKAEIDLDALCDRLVSQIRVKQTKLKEKLRQIKEKAVEDLMSVIKHDEMKLEEAQQRQGLIQHALQSDIDMDHYEMYKICKPGNVEYQAQYQEDPKDQVVLIEYDGQNMDGFLQELDENSLGEMKTSKAKAKAKPSPKEKLANSPKNYEKLQEIDTDIQNLCGIAVLSVDDIKVLVCAGDNYVKGFFNQAKNSKQSCLYLGSMVRGLSQITECSAACAFQELNQIVVFKVTPFLKKEMTITTQRRYNDIAYIDQSTLAGIFQECYKNIYYSASGIDIFDMSGTILRTFGTYRRFVYDTIISSNNIILALCSSLLICLTDQAEKIFQRQHENISACSIWSDGRQFICLCYSPGTMDKAQKKYWYNVFLLSASGELETQLLTINTDSAHRLIATDKQSNIYIASDRFIKIFGCV